MNWSRLQGILNMLLKYRSFDQKTINCPVNFTEYNELTIAPIYFDEVRKIDQGE